MSALPEPAKLRRPIRDENSEKRLNSSGSDEELERPAVCHFSDRMIDNLDAIEPRETLTEVLRARCRLTGVKLSCEAQVCGSCTVLVEGLPVSSCTYLAYEIRDKLHDDPGPRDS